MAAASPAISGTDTAPITTATRVNQPAGTAPATPRPQPSQRTPPLQRGDRPTDTDHYSLATAPHKGHRYHRSAIKTGATMP